MLSKFIFIISIAVFAALIEAARYRYLFDVYNLTCRSYSEHLKRLECKVSNAQPGNSSMTVRFMFDQDMGKDIDIHLKLFVQPYNGKEGFNFLDYKVNLCYAVNQIFTNKLLKGVIDDIRKSSNLPFKCPLKGNFLYKSEDITFDTRALPSYTPALNSSFSVKYYYRNDLMAESFMGSIIKPIR